VSFAETNCQFSVTEKGDYGNATPNPMVRWCLCGQFHVEDKIGGVSSCFSFNSWDCFVQMKLRKARNVLVAFIIIWFNIIPGCMHKWVDQFGCHVSQFCLVIAITMLVLLYRSWNLLKWTWFKDFNLKIHMMHKIIL
jgi:hypothetical protein